MARDEWVRETVSVTAVTVQEWTGSRGRGVERKKTRESKESAGKDSRQDRKRVSMIGDREVK